MNQLKKTLTLLFLTLLTANLNSQEIEHQAPTLQVGLDGINFSKGTLDPEIIARIIAEKQSEIKIKIIQNSFLKKIYGSGGTIYNYADNIIKGIVQEPDTDVRTRKIMESTVNLVFVYAFADFYLKKVTEDKDDTKLKNLQKLAKGYNLEFLKNFNSGLKYRALLEENGVTFNNNNRYLKNLQYNGSTSQEKLEDDEDHLYKFMALLIDISSEVVRENEKLSDLGLMRISYSTNYDYLNTYKQQLNYSAFTNDAVIKLENKDFAVEVYKNMKDFMNEYTSYIGALKFILESKNFKSNNISSKFISASNDKKSLSESDFSKINIEDFIKEIADRFKRMSENNEHVNENYLKDIETAINKLTGSLNYIKKIKKYLVDVNVSVGEKVLMISDILYTLKMEVIPNIEYSIKLAPELIATKDAVTDLSEEIYLILINQVEYLNNINKDPEPFIKLVSKLYEFDKTKTFSEYTNLITLLDQIFETGKFKTALSTINTFVKDYTVIKEDDKGNEVLDFNVESFLVKLDNIQSDKINRFQFHFTVGMNTTSFINGTIDLGDGQQISNFSHFSEKIGLKFKIINRGDWLPKNPGETYGSFGYSYVKTSPPKEPLISNWHVLLYGSGILYNVINSSTNKGFNYPLVGFGTGVTFYNALDFNVSIGIPLLETGGFSAMKDNAFLSFGFDIQIGEYLKEVGKKRKARKQNKQLTSKK